MLSRKIYSCNLLHRILPPPSDSASHLKVPLKPCPSYFFRIPHQDYLRLSRATLSASASSLSLHLLSIPEPLPSGPTSFSQLPPSASISFPLSLSPQSLPISSALTSFLTASSLDPDFHPLILLPQPRPPFPSASSLSLVLFSAFPQRLSLSQPPLSDRLSLPLPDPARPGPAPAARTVLTVVVVTDFPPGALSLRHFARLQSLPSVRRSVRPPARGSAQRPTQGGRRRASSPLRPSPPGLTYSRAARAPLQPISLRGDGPELGRGQGQPGEAAQGPLGLYQGPQQGGGGQLPRDRTISPRGKKSL